MSFLIVFTFCYISSLYFCSLGLLSSRFIFKIGKVDNIFEYSFLGIFCLSFIALISNFFISLNIYWNSIIFLLSFPYLFFLERRKILKILKYSLIIALISLLTIVLDHTNRPDSGLYHLPYTSLLNENKLIVGSANLNERFGIISIIQYLSAINYNFLFFDNGVLIPLVIIYSMSIVFFLTNIFDKKNSEILRVLSFLFLIFILTHINRYSGFGNDAPANLLYFILTFYLLDHNKKNFANKRFKLIIIISLFIFLVKPFFILLFILPIILILENYKDIKILNFTNIFCIFVFLIWLTKNFFVTGCILYPINISCIQTFDWTLNPKFISIEAEAWTKGWPDRDDKSLNYEQFLNNFYWINTWFSNHFKLISIKLIPFLIVLVVLILIIIFSNIRNNVFKDKKYYQLIIFNVIMLSIWFLKFPNYRFGLGIIGVLISLIFIIIFFNKLDFKNNLLRKSIIFFTFLACCLVFLKNIDRIRNNYYVEYKDYPWPKKNSHYLTNKKLNNIPVKLNGEIIYYVPPSGELCFYSKSPCTHIPDLKIKKNYLFNFYIKYSIDK